MQELNKILNCRKDLVFLDFEGTQYTQEIFAIGAIKVTLDNKNRIKNKSNPFKAIIKTNGQVGSIIENITGFTNDYVQTEGRDFKNVIEDFKKYCGPNYKKMLFVTYGNFDKKMLRTSQVANNLEDNDFINSIMKLHWDISIFFNRYLKDHKGQQYSLKESLELFNLTFQGQEHDPSADAINLMLLYDAFLDKKGIVLSNYKKVLDRYSKMPRPFIRIIKKLNEEGSVSLEDYKKYIEEDLK